MTDVLLDPPTPNADEDLLPAAHCSLLRASRHRIECSGGATPDPRRVRPPQGESGLRSVVRVPRASGGDAAHRHQLDPRRALGHLGCRRDVDLRGLGRQCRHHPREGAGTRRLPAVQANCNFPPLRIGLAGKETKGTLFDGQDKLKLVTPCHEGRDQHQQYILQEYLVYRVYELLTPVAFRVRLINVTYEDPGGGYETRTKTAFFIEGDGALAARNRGIAQELEQLQPAAMEPEQDALVALFQFMIGNTDFSTAYFHNAVTIRTQDDRLLIVPYDFDWSGVVDARYAVPDERLPITDVRERVFRGFCRPDVDEAALIRRFNERRDAIWRLYGSMPGLEDGVKKKSLEYYEDFYEILNDPRRYERAVTRACQALPT